jgi:hypothetical protein
VAVQVYDAGFRSGSSPNPDQSLVSGAVIDTWYRILSPTNAFSPLSNPTVLTTREVTSGNSTYQGWDTIGTITNPTPGATYYLQVYTEAGQSHSEGSNGFAVRAANGGSFSACSTITGAVNPNYSASCVQVHGYADMSVFANLGGSTAEFYLAQVGAQYAGKTMTIDLFDLGEGATQVQLLDPRGNVTAFNWSTECSNPPAPATGGCSGTNVTSLNPGVSGANQPYPRVVSSWVYNDRQLTLTVKLPNDYGDSSYGGKEWWKVRYTVGSSPTDRTTWSVNISGSPVHLVN